jgi:hypothetical protein
MTAEMEKPTGMPEKIGKVKTRRAGQIIRRGEKKFLLRVFVGYDAPAGNASTTAKPTSARRGRPAII